MRLDPDDFRVIRERIVFEWEGGWSVVAPALVLPNGHTVVWPYLKGRDLVVAVPLRPDGHIYLKREYRVARHEVILELPSGKVEVDADTRIPDEVNRELQEEVGLRARTLTPLITFYPWNHAQFRIHIYLATDLEAASAQPDEDELLDVVCLPLDDALRASLSGQANAQTLIGLLLTKLTVRGELVPSESSSLSPKFC